MNDQDGRQQLRIRGDLGGAPTIRVARFLQRLRQKFGMADDQASLLFGGMVVPIVGVDPQRLEDYFLAGERLGMGFANVAAAAGNQSQYYIENPKGSGMVGIVESIDLAQPDTANSIQVNITTSASLDTAGITRNAMRPRDTRWISPRGAVPTANDVRVLGLSDGTSNGASLPASQQSMRFRGVGEHALKIVLLPGWAIGVFTVDDNIPLELTAHVRERQIGDHELDLSRQF